MTSKPETIAQLRRKIERLEAQLAAMVELHDQTRGGYTAQLRQSVDAQTRIRQALRILTGEDDL